VKVLSIQTVLRFLTSSTSNSVLPLSHLRPMPRLWYVSIRSNARCMSTYFRLTWFASILSDLNPRKSPGMYHIYPFVVKRCAVVFFEAFSVIFSRFFTSSRIADAWSLAKISSIFKKDSRSLSYRSPWPWFHASNWTHSTRRDDAIATEQHGFVLRKFIVTRLLKTVDRISDRQGLHVLVCSSTSLKPSIESVTLRSRQKWSLAAFAIA